jgi:hypothetical protein
MRNLYISKSLLPAIGLFLYVTFTNTATITSISADGNWGTTPPWVGGVVPLATDIAVIASGANVSTSGNLTLPKMISCIGLLQLLACLIFLTTVIQIGSFVILV